MDYIIQFLILFLVRSTQVSSETYSVKISTEKHVNVVDSRFLSFTVDPKYLFDSGEKYSSKESVCMASSLTPAYIRIAGPSTSHVHYTNSTITYTNLNHHHHHQPVHTLKKLSLENITKHLRLGLSNEEIDESNVSTERKRTKKHSEFEPETKESTDSNSEQELLESEKLEVTNNQWKQFVLWAKETGFDLVYALNNQEKNDAGIWDPDSASNVLSMAQKANVSDIYWQLGYECTNQSVDEYLNDLETLKAMAETFDPRWRTVGGDVSPCLQEASRSDFVDYVTLSEELMDAILLNGNSTSQELERMSESDRLKLLKLLSTSKTPLWLTETQLKASQGSQGHDELFRAADWMASLGYAAKNGFAVHFRELIEEELFEPTLSFYMAMLFKNLVGHRVLNAAMEPSEAVLFAHCTSLANRPVPGAVTLFAANMAAAPARFNVKLSRREEGGDVMQFVIGRDANGNIIVNGKPMSHEGDIRPSVKRVRPYKSLLVKLPPKSFGFWVLANTNIEACYDYEESDVTKDDVIKELDEEVPANDGDLEGNIVRTKRSKNNVALNDKGVKLRSKRSIVNLKAKNEVTLNDKSVSNVRSKREIFHLKAGKLTTEIYDRKDLRFLKNNEGLKNMLDDLKGDFDNVRTMSGKKSEKVKISQRQKRDILEEEVSNLKKKFRHLKQRLGKSLDDKPKLEVFRKFLSLTRNGERDHGRKTRKASKFYRNKFNKKTTKHESFESAENSFEEKGTEKNILRKRRSVDEKHDKLKLKHKFRKESSESKKESSSENEIDSEINQDNLWKILHDIQSQIRDIESEEDKIKNSNIETYDENEEKVKDLEHLLINTKVSDDAATEKSKHGLLKSAIDNVVSVLGDLNRNLNRFWNAFSFLD